MTNAGNSIARKVNKKVAKFSKLFFSNTGSTPVLENNLDSFCLFLKGANFPKPTFWSQFYIKSSHIYYKSPNLVTLAGKQTLKTEWQQTPNNNRDMNCFDIKNKFSCPARVCTMLVPLQNKNWHLCILEPCSLLCSTKKMLIRFVMIYFTWIPCPPEVGTNGIHIT